MDDDKLKVSLEIDTENAENSVTKLSKLLSNLFNNISPFKKSKIDFDSDSAKKKLSELEDKLKRTKELQEEMKKIGVPQAKTAYEPETQQWYDFTTIPELENEITSLKKDIEDNIPISERLSEIFNNIKNHVTMTDDEVKAINNGISETNENLKESEDKENKIIKKTSVLGRIFARLGLSIRRQVYTSIASLLNPINNFKKAFTYLTEVISPRLGATFKNIGNNLIEYIANSDIFKNLIADAIKLIYVLQELFNSLLSIFGIQYKLDLFKRSMKTAKELQKIQQKMFAGFDEINDIGGGNQQAQLDATPFSLGELIDEKTKKELDTLVGKIKEILKWVGLVLIAVGAIWLIVKLFGKKNGLASISEGFSSMLSAGGKALEFIAILGGIALVLESIASLINAISESGKSTSEIIDILLVSFIMVGGLVATLALLAPLVEGGALGIAIAVAAVVLILATLALTLPPILKAVGDFIVKIGPTLIDIIYAISEAIEKIIYIIGVSLSNVLDSLGNMFLRIFTGIGGIIRTVGDVIIDIIHAIVYGIDSVLNSIITFIDKAGPSIERFIDHIISSLTKLFNFIISGIETVINNGVKAINWLFNPLRKVGNYLLEAVGLGDFKFDAIKELKLNKLATGTNYVPNDQLAYIHQGEAVIPKKFNDREYFGTGNEETNELLEELINRFDNIDFQPYTTVKDLGRAAVEYIKQSNKQLGRSVI